MENLEKIEKLKEVISNLNDNEMFILFNDYCSMNHYSDSQLYLMDEFDEITESFSNYDIAQKTYYGDFNPNDDYFCFNGYANFESVHNIQEYVEDYLFEIVDYIIDNNIDFDNDDIAEILEY